MMIQVAKMKSTSYPPYPVSRASAKRPPYSTKPCAAMSLLPMLLLLLAPTIELALAAPATPITDEASSPRTQVTPLGTFASEPRGRGTWGLLFSCSVTFVFCIWTVVHPNIIHGASTWCRLWHKATLMVVSVFIPEGIMLCAFREWHEARKLREEARKLRGEARGGRGDRSGLGMDVAFFVGMGGFVLEPEPEGDALISTGSGAPSPTDKKVLTPAGFLKCFSQGEINEKTFKSEIEDKTKANNIVKLFSGLQTVWLVVSCCARWWDHLPLTLLEIHVLIQVVCTIFTFCFWWSKPLDVQEPITLDQKISSHLMQDNLTPPNGTCRTRKYDHHTVINDIPLLGGRYDDTEYYTVVPCRSGVVAATSKAFYEILMKLVPPDLRDDNADARCSKSAIGHVLMELVFVVSFGALHAAAWNVKFPTAIEGILWRISSVGMCIFPVCCAGIAMTCDYHKDLINATKEFHYEYTSIIRILPKALKKTHDIAKGHTKQEGKWGNRRRTFLHFVGIWTCVGLGGCYCLCALYITVESFISLRAPPDRAFETPRWNDYWPHM